VGKMVSGRCETVFEVGEMSRGTEVFIKGWHA